MEEVIKLVEKQLKFASTSELEEKCSLLNYVFHQLDGIEASDLGCHLSKFAKAIQKVDYIDIIHGCLLAYYDFSMDEVREYTEILVDFLRNDQLTFGDKRTYVLFLTASKHPELLKEGVSTDVIQIFFQLKEELVSSQLGPRKEEIIHVLDILSNQKDFSDHFDTIITSYYEEKPNIDEELLKQFIIYMKVHNQDLDSTQLLKDQTYSDYNYIITLLYAGHYLRKKVIEKFHETEKKISAIHNENKKKERRLKILKEKFSNLFSKQWICKENVQELREIIEDDSIFYQLLIQILEHNNEHFCHLKGEKHSFSRMALLFKKYHYDYSSFSTEIQSSLSLIDTNKLIAILDELEQNRIILTYENLARVCVSSNLEMINYVIPFLERGIVTVSFINQFIDILCDSKYQTRFSSNIQILMDHSIDIKKVLESGLSLGNIDCKELLTNFQLLDSYGICYRNKELHNFDFLEDCSCFSIIDGFIEEGLFSMIQNHPEYLRKDNQVVPKRIHINQLIDEEIVKGERLDNQLLYENKYFLRDSQLDSFCCSHTLEYSNPFLQEQLEKEKKNKISLEVLHHEMVKLLDQFYLDGENYLFGDTIISRIKFLRGFEVIYQNDDFSMEERVFNSLIYHSLLTDEEANFIQKSIKNMKNELTFVKK